MIDRIHLALDIFDVILLCGIAGSFVLVKKRIETLQKQLNAQAKWIESATAALELTANAHVSQLQLNRSIIERVQTVTDLVVNVDDNDYEDIRSHESN